MLREHTRPCRDPWKHDSLGPVDRFHGQALVRPRRPLEPDLERLVLAAEGVAGGFALGVITKTYESLRPALDLRLPENPQEEVVVGGVDVALVQEAIPLDQPASEDDRRGRQVVAEPEVAAPAERGRTVLAPHAALVVGDVHAAEDGVQIR